MQSIAWYRHRLRSMSLAEMVWRAQGKLRGVTDRLAHSSRLRILPLAQIADGNGRDGLLKPRVLGLHLRSVDETSNVPDDWKRRAVAGADKVAEHCLSFFDLQDKHLGREIQWNHEHQADRPTPLGFADNIDYRDHAITGDCKLVWEPNRHHQLVTLGRAYRLTGDERYARSAGDQMQGWIEQCPYGVGMNWRSPLELGVRLINWVWTLELIRPASAMTEENADRVLAVAFRHMWDISRKYSRFSSANNHVIGEAAGVFVGSSYFAGLKDASRWRARSREILLAEIIKQTHPDGGTREQAMAYHLFVIQFFLIAGLVARNDGDELGGAYWERLERMFEFVAGMAESGAPLPMFGDADDGYVLDLGCSLTNPSVLMCVGAIVFDRADFKALAGEFSEPAYWLFGDEGRKRFDSIAVKDTSPPLRSRAFPETGYYLLQKGRRDAGDSVSVVFDCGELGFGAIAAHGHADALSFSLRASGVDVLVDPGTYDYFTYPKWRSYFKSTRAHNTVVVDDCDQSEPRGSFMWGRRARATLVGWEPSDAGGAVAGEHDGYTRLADPVTHRRSIELSADGCTLTVDDEIISEGRHDICVCFHLAEHCRIARTDGEGGASVPLTVDFGMGVVTIALDERLTVSTVCGQEGHEDSNGTSDLPISGWVSRGYHRKARSHTIEARGTIEGKVRFRTLFTINIAAAGTACGDGAGCTGRSIQT